jgi:iron-sulfur cluster repair protein YtfE (RIC family)
MPTDIDIVLEPMAGLTREHRVIDEAVEEAVEAAAAAVHAAGDGQAAEAALVALRTLEQFLEGYLALHIAKEEDVLFPALRLSAETNQVIDELIEQHDEVRAKRAALVAALAHLDDGHDDVRTERAGLAAQLERMSGSPAQELSPEEITELWESVRRLHWILQGHFGDEEDDLFLPAETLLSADELAALTDQIAALEAADREAAS